MDETNTPLIVSRHSFRRRIANWVSSIPKIGVPLHRLLLTKEEKDELDQLSKDFGESLRYSRRFMDEALVFYPELQAWFTEEKINLLPGRKLLASDFFITFRDFFGVEKLAPFLNTFTPSDDTYTRFIVCMVQLPTSLEQMGFYRPDGSMDMERREAIEKFVYDAITTVIVSSDSRKWSYDDVNAQVRALL